MSEHTKTPWKVFTTTDGRKLVGIGAENGEGILDCGFGVWAWNDAEGIANANLVVKAVNSHDALMTALEIILHDTHGIPDWKALEECRNIAREALAKVSAS